jgi:hypothetical protein
MRKTCASQASSSEKLMRLKQELATTAELVGGVLKREQLKREAPQQAREKHEDFANLKHMFPSLLDAKEDEELLYDKERVFKTASPVTASPVAASPVAASPIAASPIAALPIAALHIVSPRVVASLVATPRVVSPHVVASPVAASPVTTSSVAASPIAALHIVSPRVVASLVATPRVVSPRVVASPVASSFVVAPHVISSCVSTPLVVFMSRCLFHHLHMDHTAFTFPSRAVAFRSHVLAFTSCALTNAHPLALTFRSRALALVVT